MKASTLVRLCIVLGFASGLWWSSMILPGARTVGASGLQSSKDACASPLPNPSTLEITQYRELLYAFLQRGCYKNWVGDREIRKTGPFINRTNFGVHRDVRVFYSPEVWKWMKEQNRKGDIPNGAMIVKEMYAPPANDATPLSNWTVMVRDSNGSFDGWYWDSFNVGDPPNQPFVINDVTLDNVKARGVPNDVLKDLTALQGQWFLSEELLAAALDQTIGREQTQKYKAIIVQEASSPPQPANVLESGFGTYCSRCHASADANLTFSSVKNVEGDAIIYRDNSPVMDPQTAPYQRAETALKPKTALKQKAVEEEKTEPGSHERVHALFLSLSHLVHPITKPLPGFSPDIILPHQNNDHVVAGPKGPEHFITSDQCVGCHSASPNDDMAYVFKPDSGCVPSTDPRKSPCVPNPESRPPINLSPYTEWHASMMGLSGRDPIFHAQEESERILFPQKSDFLDNTCFSCHGVMGQRQLEMDRDRVFKHEMIYSLPGDADAKYGALARDGVSCASCHHISSARLGTPSSFTGNFDLDLATTVNGPYDDVITVPMKNALGITPQHAAQIKSSALCGSCHTVNTPTFDKLGNQIDMFHEQTTYLEWLNSQYQDESDPVDSVRVRSCQDCHMPKSYDGRQIKTRIANIQDTTYPFTENLLPYKDLKLKVRDSYSRHTLVGLNVFANQMFQQFSSPPSPPKTASLKDVALPNILGIDLKDYMYDSGELGLVTNQDASLDMAHNETAELRIGSVRKDGNFLEAEVTVTNLAGHSFPSGVGFRRAFVEFQVLDAGGKPLWASGGTNDKGEICEGLTGKVLPTEFFWDAEHSTQVWQPHYDKSHPITRQDQVQIYEEVVADSDGKITTSFVRLHKPVKGNRLLPRGWKPNGPYGEFTRPHGEAEHDPGYVNPDPQKGSEGLNTLLYRIPLADLKGEAASVIVQLYYQAIPPFYLKDRFSLLERGMTRDKTRETRRLKFIVDNLRVDGPIKSWKLKVVDKSQQVK